MIVMSDDRVLNIVALLEDDNVVDEVQEDLVTTTKSYEKSLNNLISAKPSIKLSDVKFPQFNKVTGGFRPNEFSILCGSTGSGKTTFLANISADLLRSGVPHFVASVETGYVDYITRVLCALSGEDINQGDPVPKEKVDELHEAYKHLFYDNKLILSTKEDRFSVLHLMKKIIATRKKYGCEIAIIDNLNFFLEVTRATDSVVEMDRVIHELIIFCKLIDMHIIMVMHPKKTENGRVVSEFDIKGSSTSVQEAHNVFLFNRPNQELINQNFATHDDRQLSIAKMRRRGKHVGESIIFGGNSVKYIEKRRVERGFI